MSKKVYDADEIMKMAVGLIEPDVANADYDGDGKITSNDARTNKRIDSGLSIDAPVTGAIGGANTGNGNKNIYASSNAYQNQADAVYKQIQEQIAGAGKNNADIFASSNAYQAQADAIYRQLQEQIAGAGKNNADIFASSDAYQAQADAIYKQIQEQIAGAGKNNADIYASSNAYQQQADAIYKQIQEQIAGAGKNNADIYAVSDAYQKQADELYEKIKNTPDFNYDFNEDAVFKALQEQYIKDGRLAAENVAGQAAALSGGYSNSYGTTAAGQAYMGSIDSLYDRIPELEALAYGRYQDKRNAELQNWEILQNRAATERGNAQAERAYNDDREAYLMQLALSNYDIMQNRADAERGFAQSERAYNDDREAYLMQLALQNYDILQNRADAERGYAESERAYNDDREAYFMQLALQNYDILQNKADKERDYAESERAYQDNRDAYLWDIALQKAQFGDYSDLKNLGVDTSGHEYDTAFNKALSMAQVGDYSGLKALGIDVSNAQKQNELDFALAAASYGDYSFLKALGINTSAMETPTYTYYSSSGGSGSGSGGKKTEDESVPKKAGTFYDVNGDGKITSTESRDALRQSQGMDSSYESDELDSAIIRLQAVIDDPSTAEGNRKIAENQLEKIRKYYYGK